MAVQRFVFSKDGRKVTPEVVKIDVSRQIKKAVFVKDSVFAAEIDGETVEVVAKGDNNNIVQFDFSKVESRTTVSALLTAGYFMRGKGKKLRLYRVVADPKAMGKFILMPLFPASAKTVAYSERMIGYCRFGGRAGGQITTASGLRNGRITMLNNNSIDTMRGIQMYADFKALANKIGIKMNIADAAKFASRLGNWMAASVDGPEVSSFAIYFGKYADGKLDGMSFTTLVKRGAAAQNRAYLCKTLSLGVNDTFMERVIAHLDKNPIRVYRSEINDVLNKELQNAIDRKGEGTRFAGRVVIICDDDRPVEYLADMNALKASFDLHQISNLNVIKYFDNKNSKGSLSSQILTKGLFENEEYARKWFRTEHQKFIENKMNFAKPVSLPTSEQLQDDGQYLRNVMGLDPKAYDKYPHLFRRAVDQALQADKTAVNEFHFPTENGFTKVLIGDLGALFGIHLLNPDEMFTNSLAEIMWTSFKFPTMDAREFANMRNYKHLVFDRIKDAADDKELSKDDAAVLIDEFQALASDIVMISADDIVKSRQAGLDFDGDSATFIPQSVTGLTDAVAIRIEAPKATTDKEITIGWNIMAKTAAEEACFGNAGVGTVTNTFTRFQYAELNSDASFIKTVAMAIGNSGKNKDIEYKPVFGIDGVENGVKYIVVNADKIQTVLSQLKNMTLTKENCLAAVADINRGMGRYYQELTIDAVKKFYNVDLDSRIIDAAKETTLEPVEVTVKWENRKILKHGAGVASGDIRQSLQGKMIADTAKIAGKRAAEILDPSKRLTEEQEEYCRFVYGSISDDIRQGIYVTVQNILFAGRKYAEGMEKTNSMKKTEDRQKMRDILNANYQTFMDAVNNDYRKVTADFCEENRVAALIGYQLDWNSQHKNPIDVVKKIGVSMLREEFLYFVAYFSERKEEAMKAVSSVVVPQVDYSGMMIHLENSNRALLQNIASRIDNADEPIKVSLVQKGKAIVLAINDVPIKGAFVQMAQPKANASAVLRDLYTGKSGVAVTASFEEGGEYWSKLNIVLNDVQ